MTPRLLGPLLALTLGSASAQTASFQLPGGGNALTGNGARQTVKCAGQAFMLTGNQNTITLTGNCSQVSVTGNQNAVRAATVGQIIVTGQNNTVSWQKALKGRIPVIKTKGSGNRVTRR